MSAETIIARSRAVVYTNPVKYRFLFGSANRSIAYRGMVRGICR